ncbi:hypothetical protein [Streptomonospora wellingtoniae]|uniref:Uncharacterized protein n=1 Tax=Streptomonospora wellingtoniae TaxID=3075544 RepID=A0ABU2KYH0_9ACTN|nr:hypothetical protein [Streptomonospora sp. DSM 45055]MDT0304108.1 hypothetical protein [Streptomonospora sp. DSM 45055]
MAKKRSKNTKKRGGAQLSGNPQKRSEQLADRAIRQLPPEAFRDGLPLPGTYDDDISAAMADPAAMQGEPGAGWEETHRRVLERARAIDASAGPLALDSLTCELVGGVYWDALQEADDGFEKYVHGRDSFHESQDDAHYTDVTGFDDDSLGWMSGLARAAARALASRDAESDAARHLLRGIASCALHTNGPRKKNAVRIAADALRKAGDPLLGRGASSARAEAQLSPVPTDRPRVLQDAYGSRVALLAPFAFGPERRDPHWYYWDLDLCFQDHLVGAGAADSMEDAVAEWRSTVGASAPDDAEPRQCAPGELHRYLLLAADNSMLNGMRLGFEPRNLVVEQFRAARRAQEVVTEFDWDFGAPPRGYGGEDDSVEDFRSWYARRNGDAPDIDEAVTLREEWGTVDCMPPQLYSSSPHRIRHSANLIGDAYWPEHVPGILALMPEWVEWCLEHTGLTGAPADAARAEARRVADQAAKGGFEPDPAYEMRVKEL